MLEWGRGAAGGRYRFKRSVRNLHCFSPGQNGSVHFTHLHRHTHAPAHTYIGTHLSICINFNVHTHHHTHTRSHAFTHARESRSKCQHRHPSTWPGEREWQVKVVGGGVSLMATGLNTFCTWQWTTTTTAYGDAVGNNFWLYFGVHVVGGGMRDEECCCPGAIFGGG